MSITFYYAPQSNATRIHWTLEELGVPYEKVKLDLKAGDQKKPEILALNPNGMVPTLVIDGTPMFESIAIQVALGERYGVEKGLWPALGSGDHLQALSWIVWGQVTLAGAIMQYFRATSDFVPAEAHNPKQAEMGMEGFKKSLGILNDRLNGRQYVLGEKFTLVDLDLASVLGWALTMLKVDMSAYPNVGGWLGRSSARPGMKVSMAG